MGGLLIFVSMVTGTAAFIALFKPLPRFRLPTRKRAGVVWVASFVLLFIGAGLSPIPHLRNWRHGKRGSRNE